MSAEGTHGPPALPSTSTRRRGGPCRLRAGAAPPPQQSDPHPHLTEPEPEPPGMDWLEVFYDLIYGVAIYELTNRLQEDTSLHGLLVFLGLFLPVWWVWMGWTVYVARVEADDAPHRLLTFAQMFAIAVMAVQIRAHDADSAFFPGAFVAARLCLLALYRRACRRIPEMLPITRVYFVGFGVGVALWAVSIFVPAPARYWLWGAALTNDFLTPWIGRRILQRIPLDWSHLVERLGTFSSIVIYTAVAGVVEGIAGVDRSVAASIAAMLAFAMAVSVWWAYSAFLEGHDLRGVLGSGQPYIYGHLPLVLGLCVMSTGVRRAIIGAGEGHAEPTAYWLIGGGMALWITAMIFLRVWIGARHEALAFWLYGLTLLAAVLFPLVGPFLPPNVALAGLTLAVGAAVTVGYRARSVAGAAPGRRGAEPT